MFRIKIFISYILHSTIMQGGELVFEMTDTPSEWGTGKGNIPVSEINDHLLLPVPYVEKGDKTFVEETVVELGTITDDTKIYYTLNGSKADKTATLYTKPVKINKSTVLRAIAVKDGYEPSFEIKSEFNKIPEGRTIKIVSQKIEIDGEVKERTYANQYSAGGDMALIDFVRGSSNYRTGAWQGYEGINLEAIVDLGKVQKVKSVSIGFLQDIGSWIFMPGKVTLYVSKKGDDFMKFEEIQNKISRKQLGSVIKNFDFKLLYIDIQYVKIIATNAGPCPDWHKGAGGLSWLFADEIEIK